MFRPTAIALVIALTSLYSPNSLAKKIVFSGTSSGQDFNVVQIASGLGTPWGLAFLDKHSILVTEKQGQVKQIDLRSHNISNVKGLPKIKANGQGGLLDVALSPNFSKDRKIYFTYSRSISGSGKTILASTTLSEHNTLIDWKELFIAKTESETSRHFGSRITFDQNDHIYFTIGDRGEREEAQDRTNHSGSVIRLKLDGSIPEDNPFLNHPYALPEIWSYGHRNPQGIAFSNDFSTLWLIEHGPRGGDEINLIVKGKNYGWPVISYGKEYWAPISVGESTHKDGMEQPIKYYVPSIAPGSLIVYSGKAFPAWKDNLMAGALKLTHINRVELANNRAINEERLLGSLNERIRDLVESPEGHIYFSTDNGRIYAIKPR